MENRAEKAAARMADGRGPWIRDRNAPGVTVRTSRLEPRQAAGSGINKPTGARQVARRMVRSGGPVGPNKVTLQER